MAAKDIPTEIKQKIMNKVEAMCDDWGYSNRSRKENTFFMEKLCGDPEVGGKLGNWIERNKIRTHIKDNIIRPLQSKKNTENIPWEDAELVELITNLTGCACSLECESSKKTAKIIAYYSEQEGVTKYYSYARGHWDKWESALRNALYGAYECPAYNNSPENFRIFLGLSSAKTPSSNDQMMLKRILRRCNADFKFF